MWTHMETNVAVAGNMTHFFSKCQWMCHPAVDSELMYFQEMEIIATLKRSPAP